MPWEKKISLHSLTYSQGKESDIPASDILLLFHNEGWGGPVFKDSIMWFHVSMDVRIHGCSQHTFFRAPQSAYSLWVLKMAVKISDLFSKIK